MKVPVYLCWTLWFVTCALARTVNKPSVIPQDVQDIMRNIHKERSLCGPNLSDIIDFLCIELIRPPEGRVKRQVVLECCYRTCSFYYIMKNYCEKPIVSLADIPKPPSSFEMTSWSKNTTPVQRVAVAVTEDAAQDKLAENKIHKLPKDTSGTVNRPPARLGVIMSTRPPIIYINRYKLTPAASNMT